MIYLFEAQPFSLFPNPVSNTLVTSSVPDGLLPTGTYPFLSFSSDAGGASITVRGGEVDYRTLATDTPPYVQYPSLWDGGYSLSISLGPVSDPLGNPSTNIGAIVLKNGDGAIDDWADYLWGTRPLTVKVGDGYKSSYSTFSDVFSCTVQNAPYNYSTVTLNLAPNTLRLDVPLDLVRYAGTGGDQGPSNLANTIIPEVFGKCLQVEGKLINEGLQIWQFSRFASAITNVKNRAMAVTSADTDYASYTLLAAAANPDFGTYVTCIAKGLVRFGSSVSLPTSDVVGVAGSTASTIIQYIAENRIPAENIFSAPEIDSTAFTALESARPYVLGEYVSADTSALALCQKLAYSAGAYILNNRAGQLSVSLYKVPSTSTATISDSDLDAAGDGISQNGELKSVKRLIVQYAPKVKPLAVSDISQAILGDAQADAVKPYSQLKPLSNSSGKDRSAVDFTFASSIVSSSDIAAVAADILEYLTYRREIKIPLLGNGPMFWVGQKVTLQTSRYGAILGIDAIVSAIDETSSGPQSVCLRYKPVPNTATAGYEILVDRLGNFLLDGSGNYIIWRP